MTGKKAEMRYIDQELWNFIQQFQEIGEYSDSRTAQKELAERLQNIPFGMILNPPLQQAEEKEKEGEPFVKV